MLQVTCRELLWEDDWSDVPSADVILCADGIYDPVAHSALVTVLKELLARPGGRRVAYLSAQIRNLVSLQAFHAELRLHGLTWQYVSDEASNVHFDALVCRENVTEITLLQIEVD